MPRLTELAVLCVVAATAIWATPLSAKTVNCSVPQQDLQKAIDGAAIGEVISVSGICTNGPFFIRRDVSLVGPATLRAPAGFDVLEIRNGSAVLENLTIDASVNEIGIYVEGASVRISGVTVRNALNEGMRLIGNAHAHASGSTFEENDNTGVAVTISSSAFFFGSMFQNNTGYGIQISQGSSVAFFQGAVPNVSQGNAIGVGVEALSTLQMGDALIESNTSVGLSVTYDSFVTAFPPPSTIENNGIDVVCDTRGGLRLFSAQSSTTGTTSISPDCLVDGQIF